MFGKRENWGGGGKEQGGTDRELGIKERQSSFFQEGIITGEL